MVAQAKSPLFLFSDQVLLGYDRSFQKKTTEARGSLAKTAQHPAVQPQRDKKSLSRSLGNRSWARRKRKRWRTFETATRSDTLQLSTGISAATAIPTTQRDWRPGSNKLCHLLGGCKGGSQSRLRSLQAARLPLMRRSLFRVSSFKRERAAAFMSPVPFTDVVRLAAGRSRREAEGHRRRFRCRITVHGYAP